VTAVPSRAAGFALTCLTITAGVASLLMLSYHRPDERRALWLGAASAFVVQLAAYAAARAMLKPNPMLGWGLGTGVRFVAFFLYALVVVPGLALPLAPALISMALVLFVSMLVEPFFLKP
jgi:hypothetical protein